VTVRFVPDLSNFMFLNDLCILAHLCLDALRHLVAFDDLFLQLTVLLPR
jgi:hypothetical protein